MITFPEKIRGKETEKFRLQNLLIKNQAFVEHTTLLDTITLRIIQGVLGMDDVATGCVVGLLGYQVKSNVFHVSRVIYPRFPRPQSSLSSLDSSPIIAFVSGLDIAGDRTDDAMCTDFLLMSKWLCGEMSLSEEDEDLAARVTRLVIGGESVTSKMADGLNSTIRYLTLRRQDHNPSVEALQTFDKLVCNLVGKIRVDVMPGVGDPAIQLFPQQPVHKIALPHAGFAGRALHLTTNPYNFTLGDRELLVTSGQNASDIRRLSGVKSGCDILSLFLKWNLLAPTFPDTVDGFPFIDRDPALMDSIPHIFVATNQPSAEHRLWKSKTSDESCLLLSVPRFSKTRMLTLVDINTRKVTYKVFGTP
ncbi:hypothetical protein WR25_25201 [Diploscapter pachys]|uniref:DNA polymerase alpha/delta/epsilon subunit B domain-containing protein n=1 Tax=Diploscapter pachys TaxID=2018661 RepID=A0A2A2LFE3_9BILA|nr:hypothetical protein WR25_25201 [Diploscapter pachys]